MEQPKISVLIICQNAERTLKRTLDSVVDFDEVVLIDGGSTDRSIEIASQYSNIKLVKNSWPGFIAQRNFSIDQATNPWCFMLDADEVCTNELRDEIFKIVNSASECPFYRIMRTEYFLGRPIETGLGRSNYQERLFIKDRVRYTGGNHHRHLLDGILVEADNSDAQNIDPKFRILHNDDYGMEDWITKVPRFVLLFANERIEQGRKVSALEVFFAFFLDFIKVYRYSWKEGKIGYINCLLHALSRALVKVYIYQYNNFEYSKNINKSSIKEKILG